MRDLRFFTLVPQTAIRVGAYETVSPTFYYDLTQVVVAIAAPLDSLRELLPAPFIYPLRLTPRTATMVVAAFQYRDSDIGAYNEVLLGTPVTVGRAAPVLAGLRRFQAHGGAIWIWQLPVTTAIARDLGVEVAGYPKYLADIDFRDEGGVAECTLREAGRDLLRLRVRHRQARPVASRRRVTSITVKDGHVLASTAVMNVPSQAQTFGGGGVELELGDHPLADRLRHLRLGRTLQTLYEPSSQSVLTGPLESWPLDRT